jgi:hypothetical protein
MLSTDCAYCGAVNQATAQTCVTCGDDLTFQPSSPTFDPNREWQPVVDPNQPLAGFAPFGLDTAISETFSLFTANFWLITRIVVVTFAPLEIFRALNPAGLEDNWELTIWSFFLGGLCNVLVVPALIYTLMKIILTGKDPGVHESYRWGLTKLGKLSICAIIIAVLQAVGFMLLIIPGIIVYLTFLLVYPIAVLEKGSVTEAFARCLELTRGHRRQIFGAQLILGVFLLILSWLGSLFTDATIFWPITAAVAIAGDMLGQTVTIMSLVMYLSLPRPSPSGSTILSVTK